MATEVILKLTGAWNALPDALEMEGGLRVSDFLFGPCFLTSWLTS